MADLNDLIATAQARSVISDLSDDTTLEPKLAALFLGISTKKLEAMRSAAADAGLPFLKMMNPSSKGRNQSIFYKLGDLRDFQKSLKVQSTFDACLKAGMADWTKHARSFYAVRSTGHLLREITDFRDHSEHELFFSLLLAKKLQIKHYTLFDAVHVTWGDAEAHSNLKGALVHLLKKELQAIEAK